LVPASLAGRAEGSVAPAGLVPADEALAAPVDLEDKAEGSVAPAGSVRLMVAAVRVEAALPIDHKVTKSLKRRIDFQDRTKYKTPGLERQKVPGVFYFTPFCVLCVHCETVRFLIDLAAGSFGLAAFRSTPSPTGWTRGPLAQRLNDGFVSAAVLR
jgi:hypothetical protein